ncbi:MAG: hypothetical protein C4527_08250 [Candidatus Omnitrophota bacterium]|jgi:hypothetical protein|nr:MAG: hypothetical protein C4527_08250 [Candidatus Omnitrophota bacterium]
MLNVIFGFWQFFLVWAIGFYLERKLRPSVPYGYRLVLAFGLGEMAISYFLFLLGLVGGLRFGILIPLAFFGTIMLFPSLFREGVRAWRDAVPHMKRAPATSLCIAILLLIYFLGTCAPEREVDALWYHLATPLYYITHGGFIQLVPFNLPSHYPMNVHLHYTLSLLIGNDTTVKVFICCHFFPILILLWSAVKRYGSKEWGLLAVAIYLSCLYFRLPFMANEQGGVFFYTFLSTVLLWYALEKGSAGLFVLASLFCGMAMGTKFNALVFCYAAQVLLLLLYFFWWKRTFIYGFRKLVIHSGISWAMMSPWMIKSFLFTRNPLYPLLGEFFWTKPEFAPAMQSNAASHGINLLQAQSVGDFIHQVLKNGGLLLYSADLIFFLGFISLLVLLCLQVKKWAMPTTSCAISYLLFTQLWGFDTERLFAVTYGVITTGIVLAMSWIGSRIHYKNVLYGLILFSLFGTFIQQKYHYLCSPNIRWFGGVYLTETARQQWLSERGIFSMDLFRMRDWIREHAPDEDELYGYQTGYLFYLHRKYIVSDYRFGEQMNGWLEHGPSYAAEQLKKHNVKWFLYAYKPPLTDSMEENENWKEFRERFLEEAHREGNVTLYRFQSGKDERTGIATGFLTPLQG